MPSIKLASGDVVKERRNGNKLKLTMSDYIKIICIISGVIISGFVGWFNLKAEVNASAKEVCKIPIIEKVNTEQDKYIATMQNDVGYMRNDIKEIKDANIVIQSDIKLVLKMISDK